MGKAPEVYEVLTNEWLFRIFLSINFTPISEHFWDINCGNLTAYVAMPI